MTTLIEARETLVHPLGDGLQKAFTEVVARLREDRLHCPERDLRQADESSLGIRLCLFLFIMINQ